MKPWFAGLLSLSLALLAASFAVAGPASGDAALAERDLAALREKLQQVEQDLSRQARKRDQAQRDLRQAERSEAQVRRSVDQIDAELETTRERLDVLQRLAAKARSDLSVQVAGLEQELRRVYIMGRDDWLRGVLSQQDPVMIGRQLVWSGYLARERNALAEQVRDALAELDRSRAALGEENRHLGDLRIRERKRLAELEALRRDRSAALVRIDQGIATRSEKIDKMRGELAELQSLVDELTRVLTDLPMGDAEPFARARGRMQWPTAGRIAQHFGQPRADGRLRWNGVLITGRAGQDVHAVHHGRVVYADWLQGMGLLVIVEHGDGYLSLYGHNRDTVTEIGDWVTPDTVIAHVGDSGGRDVPGLYFEIRQAGKPVDPEDWIGK